MEPFNSTEKNEQKEEVIIDGIDLEQELKEYEMLYKKCEIAIKKINKRKKKEIEKRA